LLDEERRDNLAAFARACGRLLQDGGSCRVAHRAVAEHVVFLAARLIALLGELLKRRILMVDASFRRR